MIVEYRLTGPGGAGRPAIGAHASGRRIAGRAIAFDQIATIAGAFDEQILPSAVDRALRGADVRMLWNHEAAIVLARTSARTLALEKRGDGLYFTAGLTNWAADQYGQTIARGDVSGVSFGFQVLADEWTYRNGRPFRRIEDLILHEVSPVTWPAYDATSVTVVDRTAKPLTAAESQRLFRLRTA